MKSDEQRKGAEAANAVSPDLVFALQARVMTTTISPASDIVGDGVEAGSKVAARAASEGAVALTALPAEERELLALTDGRRSVAELIQLSGLSAQSVFSHLASLRERGIVVPVPRIEPGDAAAGATSSAPAQAQSDSETDAAGDGASALTKAIDEYLELAASALTGAAEDNSEEERAVSSGPIGVAGPLPGMTPDTSGAPPAKGAATANATAAASSLPISEAVPKVDLPGFPGGAGQPPFRGNVTAFWIPALTDVELLSKSGSAPDSGPARADGVATAGASGSTSGPMVVVTGSPGQRVAAKEAVAASAATPAAAEATPGHVDGAPRTAAPFISAPIPFRVGNYEVATRIAQGGMGSIYVCRRAGEAGFQRLFTLKVVRQHSAQREEAVQSFKREAHVGSLLSHPNLQTVLDVGSYKDQPFLVLDYIEGTSLSELTSDDRRAPVPVMIAILMDVLRGLHHAHQLVDDKGARLGLVHGDVSPQNVLVGVDGGARRQTGVHGSRTAPRRASGRAHGCICRRRADVERVDRAEAFRGRHLR